MLHGSILQQKLPLAEIPAHRTMITLHKTLIYTLQLRNRRKGIHLPDRAPRRCSAAQLLRFQHHLLVKITEGPAIAIIKLTFKGHQQADALSTQPLCTQTFLQQGSGTALVARLWRRVHTDNIGCRHTAFSQADSVRNHLGRGQQRGAVKNAQRVLRLIIPLEIPLHKSRRIVKALTPQRLYLRQILFFCRTAEQSLSHPR